MVKSEFPLSSRFLLLIRVGIIACPMSADPYASRITGQDTPHARDFTSGARTELVDPISVLGGLLAHGAAEEFGQCWIEGGAGLLLDLHAAQR